jgi:hypothetical protein
MLRVWHKIPILEGERMIIIKTENLTAQQTRKLKRFLLEEQIRAYSELPLDLSE